MSGDESGADRINAERALRNEQSFASANAYSEGIAVRYGERTDVPRPLFCECAEISCTRRIQVSIDEWRRVHGDPRRFVIAPHHDYPEVERVVEGNDRFVVVEKLL